MCFGLISQNLSLLLVLHYGVLFTFNLLFYLFFTVVPIQETEETSKPVENVVLTSKGLQERNAQVLDGTTVKNG